MAESEAPAPAMRSLTVFLEAAPVLTRESVAIECGFEKGVMRPFGLRVPVVRLYCNSKDCCRRMIEREEPMFFSDLPTETSRISKSGRRLRRQEPLYGRNRQNPLNTIIGIPEPLPLRDLCGALDDGLG